MEAERSHAAGWPRVVLAPNPSPLTLDGTRTHLVGERTVAVVDPGPDLPAHIEALAAAIGDAALSAILVTHAHPDHAPAAAALAARFGAPVHAAAAGTLAAGDRFETDAGALVAVATPGHTPDHMAFHWPAAQAVFVGDLMLGGQETALVAPPEGDLTDYLASLERVRALDARVLVPTHGEPFTHPANALDSYVAHREARQRQVLDALSAGASSLEEVVDVVYGSALDPRLRAAAAGATRAYLDHLARAGAVRRAGSEGWERA